MKYQDKLITLSDNLQYVILKELEYEGKTYLLANEVSDKELSLSVVLLRVEEIDGEDKLVEEEDLSKAEKILTEMTQE